MSLFDQTFQYLKTVSNEMMVTHDNELKRFILTKPSKNATLEEVEKKVKEIQDHNKFKGRTLIKEEYGYLKIIYCHEEGLDKPELQKYFIELEGE